MINTTQTAATFRKTLTGYAAQARFLHSRLKADAAGNWLIVGWVRVANGTAKMVYEMTDGTPVWIAAGHRGDSVVVIEVADRATIAATENEAR